jgi:hypothetical protein
MTSATETATRVPYPTTIDVLRPLGTCDVWSPTAPNAAGFLGVSKEVAYNLVRSGELKVIRLGVAGSAKPRIKVLVAPLLAMVGADS